MNTDIDIGSEKQSRHTSLSTALLRTCALGFALAAGAIAQKYMLEPLEAKIVKLRKNKRVCRKSERICRIVVLRHEDGKRDSAKTLPISMT